MSTTTQNRTCVLCDSMAITTAAHVPVCESHWKEYAEEAAKYLPDHKRPVRQRLLEAYEGKPILPQPMAP